MALFQPPAAKKWAIPDSRAIPSKIPNKLSNIINYPMINNSCWLLTDWPLDTKICLTVPSAVEKVKKIEKIQITKTCSGDGAFREIVDSLVWNSKLIF